MEQYRKCAKVLVKEAWEADQEAGKCSVADAKVLLWYCSITILGVSFPDTLTMCLSVGQTPYFK